MTEQWGALRIDVVDDDIIVSLPGTTYSVTYFKRPNSPQLLAKRISDKDDFQGGAIGPLPIRHHEISTRLGDNDLFTVELDLDVHDEAVSHKEAPAGCVTRRSFQLEMLAASQRRKILLGIVT
jgi:hypothetical protein